MEIRIQTSDLKPALEFAQNFLGGGRAVVEVTRGLRLYVPEDDPGHLFIEASDFSKACRTRVPLVDLRRAGECVVRGEQFVQIVRSSSSDAEITLKLERTMLSVSDGQGYTAKVGVMNPDEFPSIPTPPPDVERTKVSKSSFLSTIQRLKFATDPSSNLTYPGLVFFRRGSAFATDSYKIGFFDDPKLGIDMIDFPIGSEKLFHSLDETFYLVSGENRFVALDDRHFVLIQSPICVAPNLKPVLERFENPAVRYEFGKEELRSLIRAIQRASIASEHITFFFTPKTLYVVGVGEGDEVVANMDYQPSSINTDEFTVTYSAAFLRGALSDLDEASVLLFGPGGPIKVISGEYTGIVQCRRSGYEDRAVALSREVSG